MIRLFTPESGRLMMMIPNAHSMGVTAIKSTSDCTRLVSGGGEGQVGLNRLFPITDYMQVSSWC